MIWHIYLQIIGIGLHQNYLQLITIGKIWYYLIQGWHLFKDWYKSAIKNSISDRTIRFCHLTCEQHFSYSIQLSTVIYFYILLWSKVLISKFHIKDKYIIVCKHHYLYVVEFFYLPHACVKKIKPDMSEFLLGKWKMIKKQMRCTVLCYQRGRCTRILGHF